MFAFESPWKKLNGGKKEAKWDWHSPLRSDFARRPTMLEWMCLLRKGLVLAYRICNSSTELQFPVLQQYERVDEYDSRGRRLPNTSRKDPGGKEMREARKQREENIASGKQKVSDPIEIIYPIDGGTRTTKKVFYPPFSKVDRVWEYEKIWAEMEKRI
ncbi:MAG: hypothetical protein IPL26_12705 [Leptospiraceae bacterium]|nr:hypothetical protein [Leptospiraceae bacterium]